LRANSSLNPVAEFGKRETREWHKRKVDRKKEKGNEKERGLKSAAKQNFWQHLCLYARST